MNPKIKEAVNMIGHLLEHHPTTGTAARNQEGIDVSSTSKYACQWCVIGAMTAVATALKVSRSELDSAVDSCLLVDSKVDSWEGYKTSKRTRLALARKLQKA
jgi:hypothetical protein